mmetsp:Transcript_10838/g.12913  ORF Transcript_10838/g.12913 Transcript_10838/m.12913 type:complete len:84 (-) Transcript_10838:34-285(-)
MESLRGFLVVLLDARLGALSPFMPGGERCDIMPRMGVVFGGKSTRTTGPSALPKKKFVNSTTPSVVVCTVSAFASFGHTKHKA